jgi:hypothetical protein
VTLHQSAEAVAKIIWPGMGVLEPIDADHCRLHFGGDSYADLAWMVTVLGVDFTVTEPPGLIEAIDVLGRRCLRAVGSAVAPTGPEHTGLRKAESDR